MEISKTTWWMIGGAGFAGLSIGTYYLYHKFQKKRKEDNPTISLGKGTQITPNKVGKTRQVPNWNNPFDMNYLNDVRQWLAPKSIAIMDKNTAFRYAETLKNAKGTFNDDEAIVKEIFSKKLKDKTNVAILSQAFWQHYKKDMWGYLSSFLSKKEMQTHVNLPVKRLPNYTIL